MPKRRFDKKNATHLYVTFGQSQPEFPSQKTIDEEREQEAKDRENGYRYEDWAYAEYGFPDDGYDYTQHFMTMGNGVFISPDGNVEDTLPIYDARSIMPDPSTRGDEVAQAPSKRDDSDEPEELIDVMALSRGRQKKSVPMISRDKAPNRVGVSANNNGINSITVNNNMRKDFILAVVERDDLDEPREEDQKIRVAGIDGEESGEKPEKLSKIINVFEPQGDFESQMHLYKDLNKPLDKDIERALNEGSIDLKYKSTIKMLKQKKFADEKKANTEKNDDDVMNDEEEYDGEGDDDDGDGEGCEVEEMPDDFITQLMEGDGEDDGGFFDRYQEGDDVDGFYYDDDYDDYEDYDDDARRGNPEDEEFENQQLDDLLDEYDDYGDLSGDDETCGSMSIQSILAHLEADDARKDAKKERARLTKYHLEAKRNQKLGLEAIVDEDFSAKPSVEDSNKTRDLINLQESKKEKEFVEVDDEDAEEEEKWDCESILSTYSSHMNKPKVIRDDIDKKKKKVKKGTAAQNTQKIEISKKTGLPVEILRQQQFEREQQQQQQRGVQQQQEEKVNLGEKRKKGMTPEEKKQRKKALKEEKREKRAQKKELKLAYKTAEATQIKTLQSSNINNYTTVHYN